MLTLLIALTATQKIPQELYEYLDKKDSSYSSKVVSEDSSGATIEMTSQTWHGFRWQHKILIHQPAKLSAKGTGILYITGDGPRDGDYRDISLMSEATGMPVAMLFDIPNQPLFEKREDDLIAYTFEQYLATGDATWPLLFPMAKSAIRAMDAVETATKRTRNPITRFVVTGASKRGWTTWMVGAAKDKRVVGIAPMVYDNLNVGPQMRHQIDSWGKYSEMIQDYTRRGLQQKLDSSEGQKLAEIIDPYSYRANIHVPTLIVKGANDPYWTADATKFYFDDLTQPHWLLTVPNAGHDLGGGLQAAITIGAFARSIAGEFPMPRPMGLVEPRNTSIHWIVNPPLPDRHGATMEGADLWMATSSDRDFRKSVYHKVSSIPGDKLQTPGSAYADFEKPNGNSASFIEYHYRANGKTFSLSSPTVVGKSFLQQP